MASDLFGLDVQAFPKYGSEKKGLPTNYYLTLSSQPLRLHAELKHVEFVAVQDASAFRTDDPLQGLCDGGIVYLQSALAPEETWKGLPSKAKAAIRARKLRVFIIDAQRIARETSSRPDLQVRMQGIVLLGAFLRLTPFAEQAALTQAVLTPAVLTPAVLTKDALFTALEKSLTKYFGRRGGRVVDDNVRAARRGFDEIKELELADEPVEDQPGVDEERDHGGATPHHLEREDAVPAPRPRRASPA